MINSKKYLCLCLLFLFIHLHADESNPEILLKEIIEKISEANIDEAIEHVDELIKAEPSFKIAYVIKGDLLMAKQSNLKYFGSENFNNSNEINDLKLELNKRLQVDPSAHEAIEQTYSYLINDDIPYLIYVDVKNSRLFLFENNLNSLTFHSDYYISIGKNGFGKLTEGDKKTPLGVYFLKGEIDQNLPDKYGDAAFELNYPNSYDQLNKHTGYGIWIHGVPSDTFSRAPYSSDGCIALANKDLNNLRFVLEKKNIPVIISDQSLNDLADKNYAEFENEKKIFTEKFNSWSQSWRSINFQEYLNHYSNDSTYDFKKYKQWVKHKKNVFENTNFINLSISNLSIFDYPGQQEKIYFVKFEQTYESNLVKSTMLKQQLWKQTEDGWKIFFEGRFH